MFEAIARGLMLLLARLLTGVRGIWSQPPPTSPCVYFGNHASHGDFVLIWTVLSARQRATTRPVAGADYWNKGSLRRLIGHKVVRAVLIERDATRRTEDPVAQMSVVLEAGESLILFPEGTRNLTNEPLLRFKSGIYHLAKAHPQVSFIPTWIDNLHRVLPKGEIVPIPLLCTVHFGDRIQLNVNEDKDAFLMRARAALLALRPVHVGDEETGND